jgi:sulfur relay protein TusB/DsrH
MLHLVTGSVFTTSALRDALRAFAADDDLVLMHEAVAAAPAAAILDAALTGALAKRGVHAVGADLEARGLGQAELKPGMARLDAPGLVALAVRHRQSLTWS